MTLLWAGTLLLSLLAVGVLEAVLRTLPARGGDCLATSERWSAAATGVVWFWVAGAMAAGFLGVLRVELLLGLLTAATAAMAWFARGALRRPPFGFAEAQAWCRELEPGAWLALLFAAAVTMQYVALGVWYPATDFDGLSYHLGLALHMAQDEDFRHYPGESGMASFFARGVEALMALSIQASGGTWYVNALQGVAVPPMVLAAYGAARAVGAQRSHAVLGACLPLAAPVIACQLAMTYVDFFSIAFFCTGAFAVVGAVRGSRGACAPRVVWMLLCGGLALAAKMNAVIPVGLLGFAALGLWGWRSLWGSRRRSAIFAGAFLLSALAGLSWPVRNWVQFGSPIEPFSVEAFGVKFADAPLPMSLIRVMAETPDDRTRTLPHKAWLSWTAIDGRSWQELGFFGLGVRNLDQGALFDPSWGPLGDRRFGGLGLLWLVVLLPAMVVASVWFVAQRGESLRRRGARASLLVLPALTFVATVAPYFPRFSLFLPIFGGVVLAVLLSDLAVRWRRGARLLVAAALLPFLFDAWSLLVHDRSWERLRRYQAAVPKANDTPIRQFYWLDPQRAEHAAIHALMERARPGETVSFRTPRRSTFTGFFAEETGRVRLYPFPSIWPDPFSLSDEEIFAALERERVALLLTGGENPEAFLTGLRDRGGVERERFGEYVVWEFPERRAPQPSDAK